MSRLPADGRSRYAFRAVADTTSATMAGATEAGATLMVSLVHATL